MLTLDGMCKGVLTLLSSFFCMFETFQNAKLKKTTDNLALKKERRKKYQCTLHGTAK